MRRMHLSFPESSDEDRQRLPDAEDHRSWPNPLRALVKRFAGKRDEAPEAEEGRRGLALAGGKSLHEPQVLFKKQTYKIKLSLSAGCALFGLALYDLRGVFKEWEGEAVPPGWHSAILYSHVWAFYMLISGFVVSNETRQPEFRPWFVSSLLVNCVAFASRLVYEIGFQDFIPVMYFPPER